MSLLGWALSLAALAIPASKQDSVPSIFYNQPGATDAAKAAELQRCRAIIIAPMSGVDQKELTPPADSGAFPREVAPPDLSIEACMTTRGWRIYALSARDRAALARLSPGKRMRALQALTGAERPSRGRLIRDRAGTLLRVPATR